MSQQGVSVSNKEAKHQAFLAEKRSGSLYGGWLSKYQHVERMGHDEVEGLLDGDVVVQEKLDGANLTVAYDEQDGRVVVASRNKVVYAEGRVLNSFNGAVDHVVLESKIPDLLYNYPAWVLRGEWLVRHAINYPAECMKKLYVFDVQDYSDEGQGCYLHPDEYAPVLEQYGVLRVPDIARISNPTIADITPHAVGESCIAPGVQREGVVVKRYDFHNCYDRTVWGKVVSADFQEKAKLAHGTTKYDPDELAFAALVTPQFVMKEVYKIKDRLGPDVPISVRNMEELLGRVWSEAFHELMWSFVKKRSVKQFNFVEARRLVYRQTREIALAYFNGTLLEGSGQ